MGSVGFGIILNVFMAINVNFCMKRLLIVVSKNNVEKNKDAVSTMKNTQTHIQGPHPINPLLILFWGFLRAKPGGKEDSTTNIINIQKIQIQSTKGEEKVKNKVN